MSTISLTREQLYERVWNTPIDRLAGELGLSGRGLGKLCARYAIPDPPRGYWAKKAAGKRVFQPRLPPLDDPYRQKLSFEKPTDPSSSKEPQPGVHSLVLFEQQPENRISVAADLQPTNALVLKTQRLLNRSKRDSAGMIVAPAGALPIHTSRAQHERALRIMETLLRAFEARGFPVAANADGVRVTILDEALGFGIEELTRQEEHRTTFTEQKLIDRGLGWQVPKMDHVPSGEFALVITNVRGVRQRWAEGRKRLEDMSNAFLVGLVRAALGLKEQRAEAERQERERKEEERKRQEEARRLAEAALRWREEQARVARLERLSELRERNKRLRELVTDLQQAIGTVDAGSELEKWLKWATDHIESSDPLRDLRGRKGKALTLYYYGYDHDRVPRDGFTEPRPAEWSNEKVEPGIELTCRPPRVTSYERPLKIELPEDLLLPFEWAQSSEWYWRLFRVPAALLNHTLGYGGSGR